MGDTLAKHVDKVFVLVGDAQRARLVRPGRVETLELVWEVYAATPDVRALDQAPDMNRNSPDATPAPGAETNAQFAHDVSDRVRILADAQPGMRLVVIAPSSFANALKADLGDVWPSRVGDVIHRDETKLDDEVLRAVITTRLNAQ
jgi:hypothetical protein